MPTPRKKKTALVRSPPLTALTAATYCFSFVTAQERWTPLHSAASAGHAPVVASLLAFGASPNAANSGGQRAARGRAAPRQQSGHLRREKRRRDGALLLGGAIERAARKTSREDAHLVADVHQPSAGIGGEEELDEVELACARRE